MEISLQFHGHFVEFLWKFHGNFVEISYKFCGNFMVISWTLCDNFIYVSWKFCGNVMETAELLWLFCGNLIEISWTFHRNLWKFSGKSFRNEKLYSPDNTGTSLHHLHHTTFSRSQNFLFFLFIRRRFGQRHLLTISIKDLL